MNDLEEILKKFDKEFTAIVEYHKWSDEDTIYKYDTPQYLWQDWIKNNPKPVKDFIQSAVKSRDEMWKEKIKKTPIDLNGMEKMSVVEIVGSTQKQILSTLTNKKGEI